ncbi:MAG: hypothetical protein V4736_13360 [Bdellovibrionota bacterium]
MKYQLPPKRTLILIFVILVLIIFMFVRQQRSNDLPEAEEVSAADAQSEMSTTPKSEQENKKSNPAEQLVDTAGSSFNKKLSAEEINEIRSNAKTALAAVYTSQQAYFAEFGRYTTDLKSLGWTPPKATLDFKLGFLIGSIPPESNATDDLPEETSRMDTDIFIGEEMEETREKYQYDEVTEKIKLQDYARLCPNGCTATQEGFEMLIAVPLGDEQHVDIYLINSEKEIIHVQDGLTETRPL